MTGVDPAKVHDEAHLRTMPDGTIISWLRIVGDKSSEAVAFVRREVTSGQGYLQVDVWISPGGWDPMSIAEAGVTFPCQVVRVGEYQAEHYLGSEIPLLSETLVSGVLDHGGTWAREKALECAARVNTGRGGPAAVTLALASQFQDYLDPDEPEAETEIVQVTIDVTVPPLGEVRVRYRVDELSVDSWKGPTPVHRSTTHMLKPDEVPLLGEFADALRPFKARGLAKESAEFVLGKVYE